MKRTLHDRSIVHTDTVLGESQAVTPEGFLLCKNVPIARIGMQEYLNDEICDEHDHDNPLHAARGKNGIVQVERREEDVFRPETIASFEGKDVVDDHPEDVVNPDNYHEHTVGVTLNPRRGEGPMADFIMADLLIKKASAIAAVRAGKREVSCGYDADYEPLGPGRARQHNIIGNHVALVDRGRCGFRCAIGDEDMTDKTKDKNQGVRDAAARGLLRRMLDAIKTKDRKALNAAMEEMEEEEDAAPDAPALEATGTHIHLHMGGEELAKGADPAKAGEADEAEEEEEEPENKGLDKRVMMLEASMHQLADSMRKFMSKHDADPEEEGEGEDDDEEETEDEQQGEEEAEGDVPEEDEAEVEEEPKEKDKAKKDKAKKDMKKDKKKGKDKATVRDSTHLKDIFKETVSDAEILAPGLRMPTFDSAAASRLTRDSLCLLKRRALASAQRDEKNGGAESVKTMLGKKPLAGMDCAIVDTVFNGAVALMKDRNAMDDQPRTISEMRGGKKKTGDQKAPQTPAELNAMNRAHFKQAARL